MSELSYGRKAIRKHIEKIGNLGRKKNNSFYNLPSEKV
jgi:biotin operon repressor